MVQPQLLPKDLSFLAKLMKTHPGLHHSMIISPFLLIYDHISVKVLNLLYIKIILGLHMFLKEK